MAKTTSMMRLRKGAKVEVYTCSQKNSSSVSWLPATILSGNGHTYYVHYDDNLRGTPTSYTRVTRKAIRLPPGRTTLVARQVIGNPLLQTKKPAKAEAEEVEDDDGQAQASVGSNSTHRPAGNPWKSIRNHCDALKKYRSFVTQLYMSGPTITWAQHDEMDWLRFRMGIADAEHAVLIRELRRRPRKPHDLSSL